MKKHPIRRRRRNPTTGIPKEFLDVAGNVLIMAAVSGCSLEEKVIVAEVIPLILKVIRGTPKSEVRGAVEKIASDAVH